MSELIQFNTLGNDMRPDSSTYFLEGEDCSVLIDPGPDRHVGRYRSELMKLVNPDKPLVAVILSPLPGCLSGLRLLRDLTADRLLYLHWTVASSLEANFQSWKLRPCSASEHSVRLGSADRISLRRPLSFQMPGALIGYHPRTRTLFTGPFFGSMGTGKRTGKPVLRRESVRIYTDVMTPGISTETVLDSFEGVPDFGQLAPAHGKLAPGGRQLIDTVFRPERSRCTPVVAVHRLYIRVAGLLGEETASSLFQATKTPQPDLELGYEGDLSDDMVPRIWLALISNMTQWIGGAELDVIRRTLVALSHEAALPMPESFEGLLQQHRLTLSSKGPNTALSVDIDKHDSDGDSRDHSSSHTDSIRSLSELHADIERIWKTDRNCALLLVSLDRIEHINRRLGRSGGDDALDAVVYHLQH